MKKILTVMIMTFIASEAHAQLNPMEYNDGTQKLSGMGIVPTRPNKATSGILILPAWKGIDNHAKEAAMKLGSMGFHVFIADIYGEGNAPKNEAEAGEKAGYYKKNYEAYQKRIKLALDQLIKMGANSNNVAIIGYCFGGTGAIEAARANLPVKGVVSFHGGLGKDAKRENLTIAPKVLVLHGADDPYVPAADITAFQQEMKASKADWQMIYYADAVHAFSDPYAGNDNSKGAAFNDKAARRSWDHMIMFLRETLK